MGIKKLENSSYLDQDWQDEIISKNALKLGHINLDIDVTSTPVISAGSIVDLDGVLYQVTSDESIEDIASAYGEVYIKLYDSGSSIIKFKATSDATFQYSNSKKGFYYSDGGRATAHLKYYGSDWEVYEIIDDNYVNDVTTQKLKKLVIPSIPNTEKILESDNPEASGYFGISVSTYQDYTLVGAHRETVAAISQAGRAYLFQSSTGSLLQTFESPNPESDGYFGRKVSVYGNYCLITAPGEDAQTISASGRAYLFQISTGSLLQTFESPNPESGGNFGTSASMYGDYCLISGPETVSGNTAAGRAYLFQASTGSLLQTFESPNLTAGFMTWFFGYSVYVYDNYCVIGAPNDAAQSITCSGRAYVFYADTGNLFHTFESPSPESLGLFGYAVSACEDYCLISGAYEDSQSVNNAGRAYLFQISTGSLLQTFESPNPEAEGIFGTACHIFGEYCLISGAGEDSQSVFNAGRAYLFDRDSGSFLLTFESPNPESGGNFGFGVSLTKDFCTITAPGDIQSGDAAGRTYYYIIP